MGLRYILIILLLGISSCKSQKNTQSGNLDDGLVLLTQDGYSAIDTFETMVVRDQKTLNAFYSKINRTRKPGLPVPAVDFSKEMVLVVCMGEQQGDDLPDLIKKDENDEKITFQINPMDNQNIEHTDLISSPFCVYKMPISDKEIRFINR